MVSSGSSTYYGDVTWTWTDGVKRTVLNRAKCTSDERTTPRAVTVYDVVFQAADCARQQPIRIWPNSFCRRHNAGGPSVLETPLSGVLRVFRALAHASYEPRLCAKVFGAKSLSSPRASGNHVEFHHLAARNVTSATHDILALLTKGK